eukprot:911112-Pyramimonas_sp.AAC.1
MDVDVRQVGHQVPHRGGFTNGRGGFTDRRGGFTVAGGSCRGEFTDGRGGFTDRRGGFTDRRGGLTSPGCSLCDPPLPMLLRTRKVVFLPTIDSYRLRMSTHSPSTWMERCQ